LTTYSLPGKTVVAELRIEMFRFGVAIAVGDYGARLNRGKLGVLLARESLWTLACVWYSGNESDKRPRFLGEAKVLEGEADFASDCIDIGNC
jgi:hypothetical protein